MYPKKAVPGGDNRIVSFQLVPRRDGKGMQWQHRIEHEGMTIILIPNEDGIVPGMESGTARWHFNGEQTVYRSPRGNLMIVAVMLDYQVVSPRCERRLATQIA